MTAAPRRCADCRREFQRHQEYMGSPRGLICRCRRACAERAAPVNGRRREAPRVAPSRNFSSPESDRVAPVRNFYRGIS